MKLTTYFLIFSTLTTQVRLTGIIVGTSGFGESGLVEAAANILRSFYVDRINTVGLAGLSAAAVGRTLVLGKCLNPVVVINGSSSKANAEPISPTSRYRLQIFVVAVNDQDDLAKTLTKIKNSVWWNHMASFLLLDRLVPNRDCSNAYEILWLAWTMNLLNSKFLCLHQTKGTLIYTYNPYASKAPVPWQLVKVYRGKNDHAWSLFVQSYPENAGTSWGALDFDKTTDLDGYEIRAAVQGMETWSSTDPGVVTSFFDRAQFIYAETLTTSLKATWKFSLYPSSDFRPIDKTGKPLGVMAEVIDGISDISFNFRILDTKLRYPTTYPHFSSALSVITQHRGLMSQLAKIVSVLDVPARFGLLLVCSITLLFFRFHLRQPLTSAGLNVVLLICNASLRKIPRNLAPRIYLACLFIFVVTIQGIYQGKLASLLTREVSLPEVNTIDDLARSGHTVYSHEIYHPHFNISELEGRFVELKNFNCTTQVLRDPRAACVNEKFSLVLEAARFNLHRSHPMTNMYSVYMVRPNWPLGERVDTILMRCRESHLLDYAFYMDMREALHSRRYRWNRDRGGKSKAIVFEDLSFAFVILGIGLGCATLSVVVEIAARHF